MSFFKSLTLSVFLLIVLLFTSTHATDFLIQNNCPYTVWAAAYPGGGQRLLQGESWNISAPSANLGQYQARIWGRTGCNFDFGGRGNCQTGDCNGLLQCAGYGAPPNTLAELTLNVTNQLDFFDISLVDGFNVPMEFSPTSDGCTKSIKCSANINQQCPEILKAPGGCNSPCAVFQTDQYCCTSGECEPTDFSKFFKDRCPDAFSYPMDGQSSTFTCPTGTNYKVVFCPDPDGDTSIVSKRQLYLLCEI